MINFVIADTFTDSLAKLTPQEQKVVKVKAFELQVDPSGNGNSFHKLDRGQDKNFWSVRVNSDIRIIVHKQPSSLLLAYVAHHDEAYRWGEKRKLERHPTTGAMQIVEVKQISRDIRGEDLTFGLPTSKSKSDKSFVNSKPKLFDNLRKPELMAFGVPEEWIDDVREATDDTLLDVISHLPQEAQESLLRLAVGEKLEPSHVIPPEADPFTHPDAQRRFRVMTNVDELKQALEYPWEKWAVFLHPAQNELVKRHFTGPARVSGSAGTGKTIVALHRAVYLARKHPTSRVLLTTFTKPLANAIHQKLILLSVDDQKLIGRISVNALNGVGYDIYTKANGQPNIASTDNIIQLLKKAADSVEGHKFTQQFLITEWLEVIDSWQITSWEAYRDTPRMGRRTRVGGKQRELVWSIFVQMRKLLSERKLVTWSDIFGRAAEHITKLATPFFDFIVVDECQDLSVPQARFLAALGGSRDNALFFAGDTGQRIFQSPFSWKSLGIDIRGRSTTLRLNYRTSHQIRTRADKLLPASISDVDGEIEKRKGTVSLFDGPEPITILATSDEEECSIVASWIKDRISKDCKPEEIALFVRSTAQLRRARSVIKLARVFAHEIDDKSVIKNGSISISTMSMAKGHEFRAVAVMACDDGVLPLEERINTASDEGELEDIYNTERSLLYVACTRARDFLLVTGVKPGSEFLSDMA